MLNLFLFFSLKSNFELNRAFFLFKIIGNSTFVKLSTSLTNFALKFHLPVTPIIKATVFDHFCGGVSEEDCIPVINKMFKKNDNIRAFLYVTVSPSA